MMLFRFRLISQSHLTVIIRLFVLLVINNHVAAQSIDSDLIYMPPANVIMTEGSQRVLSSSIDWNQPGEKTQSVLWSGCGAEYLTATDTLNPLFSGDKPNQYALTQIITSSQGRKLSTDLSVTVNPVSRTYQVTRPQHLSLGVGMSRPFESSVQWHDVNEKIEQVYWSGSGARYLNNPSLLNPVFTSVDLGEFILTQQIKSNLGQLVETEVKVTVHDLESSMNDVDAARFLQQATFGPSMTEIALLKEQGFKKWLLNQQAIPPSFHLPILVPKRNEKFRWEAWSKQSTYAPDQLRQRMAFALSEILTLSFRANNTLYNSPAAVTGYYDTLVKHALGSFESLLIDVTKQPAMGIFLTYKGNTSEGRPDENYAREIMQLFTIGTTLLNDDGTEIRDDDGNPIPAYTQATVEQFAKVFTGLCFAQPQGGHYCHRFTVRDTFHYPMRFWESKHDKSQKILLNGVVLPPNQSAEKDLSDAIQVLVSHSNTAPFISKQLIQRLVTSNPSKAYVKRVATVFKNSGADLGKVADAILLDPEARFSQHDNHFGKVREPLIKMTHLFRALDAPLPASKQFTFGNKTTFNDVFGQAPLYAPSVFNFFMPDYAQGEVTKANLVAPELQILSASQLIRTENQFRDILFDRPRVHYPSVNFTPLQSLYEQQGVEALLERIDLLFTSGLMSECMKATIRRQVSHMIEQKAEDSIIRNILAFVMQSPEFVIQR